MSTSMDLVNGWTFANPQLAPKHDRSYRMTPEKYEGRSTSSRDHFRSEETDFRAEKGKPEEWLEEPRLLQDTAAAKKLPSPVWLSGPESREKAGPKRPSMLRRLFTSPTKRPLTTMTIRRFEDAFEDVYSSGPEPFTPLVPPKDIQYQQHAQHPAANALPTRASRPRSDSATQEKAKHKHSSNRHAILIEPARSRYEADNSVHGEDNRQTSKTDFLPKPIYSIARKPLYSKSSSELTRDTILSSQEEYVLPHRDSADSQHTFMTTPGRLRREVRSLNTNAVGLSSRIHESIDEDELTPKSILAVQIPVESPKPVGIKLLSSVFEPVLSREPGVHPKAFGWTEDHLVLGPTDEDILVATNHLGHGSLGVVEEVRHIGGQFPTLVRKRVKLPPQRKRAAAYLNIVQEEARILRSLVHPHIVTLIGSYEDMKQSRRPSYCLLMSPVGESDLEQFLINVGDHDVAAEFSIRWRNCIRNWMACLASALKYMHASGIRHQDIKPSNIIHKGDHVFFTDFSSSSSFDIGHTTSTDNPTRSTPMYGAPEVTSDRQRHGRNTDIFSLGCVFSDMLSVVEGRTVPMFQDYLHNDGDTTATEKSQISKTPIYSEKIPVIRTWFADSLIFNTHVSPMLHPDRKLRPAASEVLQGLVQTYVCDASCSCLRAEV